MKKLFAPFISIGLFILFIYILSYVLEPVANFLAWFFLTKKEVENTLTTGQAILIDIFTHIATYSIVGAIFNALGAFDKNGMHLLYVIISELISLGLAILMRFIIDYYWIIFIILGIMVLTVIGFYLYKKYRKIN